MHPARVGHYRLERPLDASAGHEEFAAWDEQLERPVRIVGVPLDGVPADDRERWRREVRAMAAVTHPAVVHILDILHQEGSDWIISEWVEGDPLDKLVAGQPLAASEVVRLGAELADALAAVHHRHLAHGRLGLPDILLTRAGHLKVGGFYLPPWASTESHELSPANRSAADLRALGQVMLALLGMPAEASQGAQVLQLSEIQEAIGKLGGELVAPLERLVAGLLAVPGVSAYEGLDAPAAELHALSHRSQTATQTVPAVLHARTPWRRRWWLPAAIALVLVAVGAVTGWWWWTSRRPLAVAVLPVEAPADTEEARLAAVAVYDTVWMALAGEEGLVLTSGREVQGLRARGRSNTEIARELAVQELVEIKLQRVPPQPGPLLELTRRQARSGAVLWTLRLQADTWEPAALRELASDLLRGAYRGDYLSRASLPSDLSADATRDWVGLRSRLASGRMSPERSDEIRLLRSILDRSPRFAAGWAFLADLNYYRFALHLRDEDRIECERSLARAKEMGASPVQTGSAEIGLCLLQGQNSEAIQIAETMTHKSPGNPNAWGALGMVLSRVGRYDEAETAFRRSARLLPSAQAVRSLAKAHADRGDYDGARALLAEARSLAPESELAQAVEAEVEMYAGNHEVAYRLYQDLVAKRDNRIFTIHLGNCAYYLGRLDEAGELYRRAVHEDPSDFLAVANLGDVLLAQGDAAGARERYADALRLVEAVLASKVRERSAMETRARCLAELGRAPEATRAAQDALDQYPVHPATIFTAALVSALTGDHASAVAWTQKAVAAHAPLSWFVVPEFDRLRADPAFQQALGGRMSLPRT